MKLNIFWIQDWGIAICSQLTSAYLKRLLWFLSIVPLKHFLNFARWRLYKEVSKAVRWEQQIQYNFDIYIFNIYGFNSSLGCFWCPICSLTVMGVKCKPARSEQISGGWAVLAQRVVSVIRASWMLGTAWGLVAPEDEFRHGRVSWFSKQDAMDSANAKEPSCSPSSAWNTFLCIMGGGLSLICNSVLHFF